MGRRTICPKCGTEMSERAVTTADGTPLGVAGEGAAGALTSVVCPACGYAELYAAPAGVDGRAAGSAPSVASVDAGSGGAGRWAPKPGGPSQVSNILAQISTDSEPGAVGVGSSIILVVSAALMFAGLVWLYMASGPVMEAGGFVARGGPYVIAHQAEDWIWLPTMGATLMMFALMTNYFVATRLNRPAALTLLVFWTAIFGLLSIPFFKYGFNAPGGGRSWTWIILGFMFAAFAIPSCLILLVPDMWRGFSGRFALAQVTGVVLGIVGGLWIWSVVAG